MPGEEVYVDTKGQVQRRKTITGSEVEADAATAAAGTTAGKGLGAKGKTAGLPKRADFDDQDAWIEAVRKYRTQASEAPDEATAAEGRKRALARMK